MKKADMENHHDEYTALEARISAMVGKRDFPAVFPVCVATFEHIVPAIKHRRQSGIEPEMPALLSFGVICDYAPLLFEHSILESLLAFVRSTRLLTRHENGYLERAESASKREETARVLWNHLEQNPGVLEQSISQQLGVSHDIVVEIVEVWGEFGIVVRKKEQGGDRLHLRSVLDAEVQGVCPNCGIRGTGRKELFFKPISCQKCGVVGYYHIKCGDAQDQAV